MFPQYGHSQQGALCTVSPGNAQEFSGAHHLQRASSHLSAQRGIRDKAVAAGDFGVVLLVG